MTTAMQSATSGAEAMLKGAEPDIALAPGAEENGLAVMLSELVRQNLQTNPHKMGDFDALSGVVAIIAEDAEVSLTLSFCSGGRGDAGALRIYSGIVGRPHVTIRATSDTILALSNMPLRYGLPIPRRGDVESQKLVASVFRAMRNGSFKIHGMLRNLPLLTRLTRVMSVNG
jgi:hypothetical protein